MRVSSFVIVALGALLAHGCSAQSTSGTVPPGSDGGLEFPDTGQEFSSDAGTALGFDGGSDTGPTSVRCTLGPAEQVKEPFGTYSFNLYGLVAPPGHLALSFSRVSGSGTERFLRILDEAPVRDTPVTLRAQGQGFIPVELDYQGGRYFLAGNDESGGKILGVAGYSDDFGTLKNFGFSPGHEVVSGVRESSGGRVLAFSRSGATPPVVTAVIDRFDEAGKLTETLPLTTLSRGVNQWDLEWRHDLDEGEACGTSVSGANEVLTLFHQSEGTVTERPSTFKLAPPPAAGISKFGCRLSLGPAFAAVVVAESEGKPRLLWLATSSRDATVLGGPVPLLPAYVGARQFDVAVSGGITAVAYLDNPTGAARITVQIYPAPGALPTVLKGDEGLSLGAFSAGKVRIVRAGANSGDFALAFDATSAATARTDTYFRRIRCSP